MSDVDRSQWIVNHKGNQYATWPYVLDEAHRQGLIGITCELVQIPSKENDHTAIVKARAAFGHEEAERRVFIAYGDASPANVSARIASALIRTAETRAKGRALRDACNIGACLLEELPDDERQAQAVGAHRSNGGAHRVSPGSPGDPAPKPTDMAIKHGPVCEVCQLPLSANLYRSAMKHFQRPLCEAHGREHLQRLRAEAEMPETVVGSDG